MYPPKRDCFAFDFNKCIALRALQCLGGQCSFYKTRTQVEIERHASEERLREKELWDVYKANYHL